MLKNEPLKEHLSALDKFVVIEELGRGSYGIVYKVQNRQDLEFYVLKKIGFGSLSTEKQELALREVKILSTLDHPSVVR